MDSEDRHFHSGRREPQISVCFSKTFLLSVTSNLCAALKAMLEWRVERKINKIYSKFLFTAKYCLTKTGSTGIGSQCSAGYDHGGLVEDWLRHHGYHILFMVKVANRASWWLRMSGTGRYDVLRSGSLKEPDLLAMN